MATCKLLVLNVDGEDIAQGHLSGISPALSLDAWPGIRQVETGSDDPDRIGNSILYYGNTSLWAVPNSDSVIEVYGTDGKQDTPMKWEGFGQYVLVYLFRKKGTEYLGDDAVVRVLHESCGFEQRAVCRLRKVAEGLSPNS